MILFCEMSLESKDIKGGTLNIDDERHVLVFHGFRQSPEKLEHQMHDLIERLSKKIKIKFTFLPAKFIHPDTVATATEVAEYRQWWTTDRKSLTTQSVYDTVSESVEYVEKFISEQATLGINYDILMGFSQGASLLQFLPSASKEKGKKLIFVGGISAAHAAAGASAAYYDNESTLHIYGSGDELVNKIHSLKLASHYKNAITFEHGGKHYVPTNAKSAIAILNFIACYSTIGL